MIDKSIERQIALQGAYNFRDLGGYKTNDGVRPTDPYPQQIARNLGYDLINLGLAGGAHLEPEIADYIANRTDWHIATVEMGINVIHEIDVDEFQKRVDYFVSTLAQKHPGKWIFCIDLFTCIRDFETHPKTKLFRSVVKQAVAQLNFPRLVYVSGKELLVSPTG